MAMTHCVAGSRRAGAVAAAIIAIGACASPDATVRVDAGIRAIEHGAVYAGGPGRFADVHELDSLRIKTVLDLDDGRVGEPGNQVERDWQIAQRRGIRFIHMPLPAASPPSLEEFDWAVNVMSAPWTQPVLVRSDHGEERTRAIIAAYRIRVQGWTADSAYREMISDSSRDARFADWRARLREFGAAANRAQGR